MRVVDFEGRIILWEGLRLTPYPDPPDQKTKPVRYSIGYGHRLPEGTEMTRVTEDGAHHYFRLDLGRARDAARLLIFEYAGAVAASMFLRDWDNGKVQPRWGAIVDQVFNLGPAGSRRFVKMWAAIREVDWELAAAEMLDSEWGRSRLTAKRCAYNAHCLRYNQVPRKEAA